MVDRRIIFLVAPFLAAVLVFWLLLLSPKRDEASSLQEDVERLEARSAELDQLVAAAENTRDDFPLAYKRLVALGKAVPEEADTASLFVELKEIGTTNGVEFRAIELQTSGEAEPAPATPAPGEEGSSPDDVPADEDPSAVPASAPAPATEAAAAGLPPGATIGPAGLPVMPYRLEFRGSFFGLADFFSGVDGLVRTGSGQARARGRLVTIDGFALTADPKKGFPALSADLAVTTYITPPGEGLANGATPTAPAPAPVGPVGEPTPASNPGGSG